MSSIPLKLVKAQKKTRTFVDTLEVTKEMISGWKSPPFQRPLRVNEKVRALAETITLDGGVIPGVLTVGILNGQRYLLDGQHRAHAFLLSGLSIGYADVRTGVFDSMGEMGVEFVTLNSSLVSLRPDDILRGLEGSNASLAMLRKKCPFIGYDSIRRGASSPLVSMSQALRCWYASSQEAPATSGKSALHLANELIDADADALAAAMSLLFKAWGRDAEYHKLWTVLTVSLCLWLYRRTVLAQHSPRTTKLSADSFTKCCMALSADAGYLDWIVGRQLRESDRRPCYDKIKVIFARRMSVEHPGVKAVFPQPAWSVSR